jgi:O-antigen/teichoic acid export membrane protein
MTVFTAGAIIVAVQGGGVVALAAVSLATTVLYGIALYAGLDAYGLRPAGGAAVGDEFRCGLPLLALRATGVGYRQLDKVVLGLVVGSVAVAGFDIADKVNLAALTVLGIATSALIPAAAHGLRTAPERTRALALRATEWSALLTLPLVGFVFGAATPLAEAIAGEQIPGAPAAIRWLALSTGVSVIYAATFEMAIGAAAASRLVRISLIGLALNLVGTVVLARAYGLPGSAAATFFAAAIITPIVARICADVFGHPTWALLRAVIPALILGAIVGVISWLPTLTWSTAEALIVGSVAGAVFTLAWLSYTWHRARVHGAAPSFHPPTMEELT